MTFKKLEKSEIEIETEIKTEELEKGFQKILEDAAKEAELPGFRKGKAPLKMVREKIGDAKLLDEAALELIEKEYPRLLEDHKIRPIGSPAVTVLKLALGNPLSFKIKVAVLPEFDLPEYKKIASEINKIEIDKKELEVEDKEVEEVLLQIRSANLSVEEREAKKQPPELTDAIAKELGNFKNKEELSLKIKENISREKEARTRDKKRAEMIEKLIAETAIDVPEVLIESELGRMLSKFSADIERMGMNLEDYLKKLQKTPDDLMKEWRLDAEKNAKFQLILNKIAETEKLLPTEEKVDLEVSHLLTHHKDADPEKVRIYVETVLTNDLVLEFLESQK